MDPGGDLNVPAGHVVPHGIVHQVGDQAHRQGRVPGDGGRAEGRGQAHAPAVGVRLAARHHQGGDLGEVERLAVSQAGLAVGQREQRVDEAFLLLAELEQLLAGGPQRFRAGGGIGECHLQDGPLGGEGRAQLMGRVRDEAPLRLERGLKTGEQPVERAVPPRVKGKVAVFQDRRHGGRRSPGQRADPGDQFVEVERLGQASPGGPGAMHDSSPASRPRTTRW